MSFGIQGGASYGNMTGFEAYSGGKKYFLLTSAMSTNAEQISASSGRLAKVINSGGATITLTFYDSSESDSTSLSAAPVIFSGVLNTTSTPLDLQIPFINGLVVKAGGAVGNTVTITFS